MASKKKNQKNTNSSKSKQKAKVSAKPKVVDVEIEVEASSEAEGQPEISENFQSSSEAPPKIEIRFAGSEYLRAQFPKSFEVAETVASDWVNNGNFEGLPIDNPLAQFVASKGLQKAKEVEKKVLESPVTEKIAMKAFEVGLKAQSQIQELKKKLQK